MKSKFFIFTTLILVVFLFIITSCDNFLNAKNKTTININLDLSKILKTSRNETSQTSEYTLKIFVYDATNFTDGVNVETLPLVTQAKNVVDTTTGEVHISLEVPIDVKVIFVAKLFKDDSQYPLYAGKSEVIKIKATDNKVHLVLTRENADLDIDILIHDHTFATDWTSDESYHWHAATCEHTTEVSEKSVHSFGNWTVTKEPTEEEEGTRESTCTVCEYTTTESIEKLAHTHTYEDDWSTTSEYHWHSSTCGHGAKDSGKHTFEDGEITKVSTCTENGEKNVVCTVCNYTKKELADKAAHIYTNGTCVCGMEEMALIYAGNFKMGSNVGNDNEKPVHNVTITKNFYMKTCEVTQSEYETYCIYGEYKPGSTGFQYGVGNNYPAYYVSWYDVLVYCNRRSMAEGLTPCYRINESTAPEDWGEIPTNSDETWDAVECDWDANGYRLPTEAEWEYAARAGNDTVDALIYSGTDNLDNLDDYAWWIQTALNESQEVGTKLPNNFGLYDMSGNVQELCWNRYTDSYDTTKEGGTDPKGTSTGDDRVCRGGAWDEFTDNQTVSKRYGCSPYNRYLHYVGFRVVRTATE